MQPFGHQERSKTRSLSRGEWHIQAMSRRPQSTENDKHALRALLSVTNVVDARLENLAQVLWVRSSAAGHDRQELVPHARRQVGHAHVRQRPQHVCRGLADRDEHGMRDLKQ